jgi:dATP pyrophosphohydrolase
MVEGYPIESPGVQFAVVRKVRDEWQFLIMRRSESQIYGGKTGFLGGAREKGETVYQTASRELKEETGFTAQAWWATEYVVSFYDPYFDKIFIFPLLAAVVASDAEPILCHEHDKYEWLPAEQAKNRVTWRHVKRELDDIAADLTSGYPPANWKEMG